MAALRPFNVMAKPIGPRCNIACSYCYYLEKERLFPQEKKFRMPPEVLESHVRQLIETSAEAGMTEVPFAWQGGEPTILGLGFFRHVVELQRKYLPAGLRAANMLQTNGMLLDDDWGRFLKENGFLVGISIDGPKRLHNRYRVYSDGSPSFDRVMRGLEVLQRHAVDYNALTTVHRANGGKGKEVYRFLRELGVEFMQFIPIVERRAGAGLAGAPQQGAGEDHAVTEWSVGTRAYGKFLCDVFDIWFRHDIGRIYVQLFDTQLGLWLGQPSTLCVFAETCGNALALEHDGSLYACDHYVYPEYRLGRITETPLREMLRDDRLHRFGEDKRDRLTAQCRSCRYRFACNGGCPKHRFARSDSGEPGQDYFCESHMMFFRHAGERLQRMARLVAAGRPAAEAANRPRG